MTIDVSGAKNVLIIRTDHLGDLLLSTPLIRTLRSLMPGRRFVLVSSPANAGALNGWDALDGELVFDPSWSLARKCKFLIELRRTRWDLCLTLARHQAGGLKLGDTQRTQLGWTTFVGQPEEKPYTLLPVRR